MRLRVGERVRSQVCAAELMVIRAPSVDVELSCGGHPVVSASAGAARQSPADERGPAPQLGKRYVRPKGDLELLAVKAGTGGLLADGEPLALRDAKPLPASD